MSLNNCVFGNLIKKGTAMLMAWEDSSICTECGHHFMFHPHETEESLAYMDDPSLCQAAIDAVSAILPLPPRPPKGFVQLQKLVIRSPPPPATQSLRREENFPPKNRKVDLVAWVASTSSHRE